MRALARSPAWWIITIWTEFNERNVLTHAGKVSKQLAEEHAHAEFAKYDAERLRRLAAEPCSDFDKLVQNSKRVDKLPTPPPSRRKKNQKA